MPIRNALLIVLEDWENYITSYTTNDKSYTTMLDNRFDSLTNVSFLMFNCHTEPYHSLSGLNEALCETYRYDTQREKQTSKYYRSERTSALN